MIETIAPDFTAAKILSPRRKSTQAHTIDELAREQLEHFGIDPHSAFGQSLEATARHLYHAQANVSRLWELTLSEIEGLDRTDRIAYFNAKKFLCFQLAKVLDTLQNPFRKTYQHLGFSEGSLCAKGPYPVFDNVTAIFSANPVIVRTATYIYACTEWVDDAFKGKELLHEIYSRLLNPTSISLANHMVDVEAGPYAADYMAWNFNSGMAAIDALFANLLRRDDIAIVSRNIYGGTYQLLHDYYARPDRLNVTLAWFDGSTGEEFAAMLRTAEQQYAERLRGGARILVYLESPCNPHGYVLDVPGIARVSHECGHLVALDSTIATPFLQKPLQQEERTERPDYVIHSYTKDLTGNGSATAGCVIGENHRMFVPKDATVNGIAWSETLFWSVYYIKGAFLDSDKAYEVLNGMKTLALRVLQKSINTIVLARALDAHPSINVHCNALEDNPNAPLRKAHLAYGLPVPLFTIDFESAGLTAETFKRFFDALAPAFDHQVSLGQTNTLALCPAFTSHSELSEAALREAHIAPTTIRISVGNEHPLELIAHLVAAARLTIDPECPGFSTHFMPAQELKHLYLDTYLSVHRAHAERSIHNAE